VPEPLKNLAPGRANDRGFSRLGGGCSVDPTVKFRRIFAAVYRELYAHVPPATKEQEQAARKKARDEWIEREYARAMASIPLEDDRPPRM
jgi:hypothetical protein